MKKVLLIFGFFFITLVLTAQTDSLKLTLKKAIDIALDSSLNTFRAKTIYKSSYWSYNSYKANRLPSMYISSNPVSFNRSYTRQYSIQDTGYLFIRDQSLFSQIELSTYQNIPLTGGTFYLNSDLSRIQNISSNDVQFFATPFRFGFTQPIYGYNSLKWLKKIEPKKFEKAKQELVLSSQEIAILLIPLYFNFLRNELNLQIAEQKLENSDTLYNIGLKRYSIASIERADLLTLQLNVLNAKNEYTKACNSFERARDQLFIFLNLNKDIIISLEQPKEPDNIFIDPDKAVQFAQKYSPFFVDLEIGILQTESEVEKLKRESILNAKIDASFGFNQQARTIQDSYHNLSDQQIVSLTLNIPLVDWGVRKSIYNISKSEYEVKIIETEQKKLDYILNIIQTVNEFNLQDDIMFSTKEAAKIAIESYEISMQRYLIGKIDINDLLIQQNNKETAQRNVINELEKFWILFYEIQSLTLYNFIQQKPLTESIEFDFPIFK